MIEQRSARGTTARRDVRAPSPVALLTALVVVLLLGYLSSLSAVCPLAGDADASLEPCCDAATPQTAATVAPALKWSAGSSTLAAVPLHLAAPPLAAPTLRSLTLRQQPAAPVALLHVAPKQSPPRA